MNNQPDHIRQLRRDLLYCFSFLRVVLRTVGLNMKNRLSLKVALVVIQGERATILVLFVRHIYTEDDLLKKDLPHQGIVMPWNEISPTK